MDSKMKATILVTLMTSMTGCAVGMTCDNTPDCDPVGDSADDVSNIDVIINMKSASSSVASSSSSSSSSSGAGGSGSSSSVVSSSSSSSSATSGGGGDPIPPSVQCDPGLSVCGSECFDLVNDASNCGACGNVCAVGKMCFQGKCAVPASLYVAGDDSCTVYIDGAKVVTNQNWFVATKTSVILTEGPHVIAIRGKNLVDPMVPLNPGGMIAELNVGGMKIATGSDWLVSNTFNGGWMMPLGKLFNPQFSSTYGDIFATMWWNRDPFTFAAKNFPDDSTAMWIWSDGQSTDGDVYFRKEFNVK